MKWKETNHILPKDHHQTGLFFARWGGAFNLVPECLRKSQGINGRLTDGYLILLAFGFLVMSLENLREAEEKHGQTKGEWIDQCEDIYQRKVEGLEGGRDRDVTVW